MTAMPSQAELAAGLLEPERPIPSGLAPEERFAVYRNNVVIGLIEALARAYPAVKALVGDAFFRTAGGVHVRESPPTSPLLIHYGADFPAFLERFGPARNLPFLGDVARLERAWLEAYHAADAPSIQLAALARLPAAAMSGARLHLLPSARVLVSRWPIASLWAANTGRGEHAAVDLKRPEAVLVLRPDEQVEVHMVEPGTAALAQAFAAGLLLAEAGAAAFSADPDFDLGNGLARLFALRAIAGIHLPKHGSATA